jgi:predicted permease
LPAMLRSAVRQPAMVLPAVALVAAAVGVSTALFSYLGALLWPRLDGPAPGELAAVYFGSESDPRATVSHRELELLRGAPEAFAQVAASSPFGASLGQGGQTRFVWGYAVSGGYFELFGARPARGRLLQPADDRPGAPPVAVLHHAFWQTRLGGDPDALGRPLELNGRTFTVVGIAPPRFQGHGHAAALYVPLAHADAVTGVPRSADPEARWLGVLVRRAPGRSWEQVEAAVAAVARAADTDHPLADGSRRPAVVPAGRHDAGFGPDPIVDSARALFAGALLFLLLACASLANLLLARAADRQREWAIRACLGEPRWRLAGTVAAESALLCGAGTLLGLPLAAALAARLEGYLLTSPAGLAGWSDWSAVVRFDGRAVAFAGLAATLCAALAASVPVARLLRGGPIRIGGTRGGGATSLRGRRALVAVQLALSVALCLGGGLLARSLANAAEHDPGFPTRDLHLATLYTPRNFEQAGSAGLPARLQEAMKAVPGISHASLAHMPPLAGWFREATATPAGRPETEVRCAYDLVTKGWFETMAVPLVAGRDFTARDDADAPPVVVVSQALAVRLWGDAPAVGRRLGVPGSRRDAWEVVGVAADLPPASSTTEAPPALYFPVAQRPHGRLTLLVRSPLPPAKVAAAVRATVRRVHPGLSLVELTTAEEARRRLVLPQRMHAELATLFAALGLLVAVVGLFGLLSHVVSASTPELALRMAVGATPRDLLRLVLAQAARLLVAGVGLGLALWLPLSRLVGSLLVGVRPLDPWVLAAVPLLLGFVALVASAWPAMRASRLDPVAGLRHGAR